MRIIGTNEPRNSGDSRRRRRWRIAPIFRVGYSTGVTMPPGTGAGSDTCPSTST
jgi:hypothetical protein